ncbi:hypothetical protein ScPMuIL_011303 [Solemya velum]
MAASSTKLLVAAIDFGTTFSGYAYSFRHQYKTDPANIMHNVWLSRTGLLSSMKTPTCLLLKPDKSFAAFGYDAENEYSELALEELEDETGKTVSAITVFSLAIKFLKEDLLQMCKNELTAFYEEDDKAGIREEALEIVLEPEAALVCCRHIPLKRNDQKGRVHVETFNPGSKYLVVDAGRATVDITALEITQNRSTKVLHQVSGGPWGGTKMDDEFSQLLMSILGAPVFKKFQEDNMEDYLELSREFELMKRNIKPGANNKRTFRVPASLKDVFQTETKEKIQDVINDMSIRGKVKWIKDKMQIEASLMEQFFEKAIREIIKHIESLLQLPKLEFVTTILMVGGFSESAMLQEAVKSKFSNKQVLIPPDAGAAVLKGAVMYGHNPRTILERVCKYTYGVETSRNFDETIHNEEHRETVDGVNKCNDIFDKHVQIGTTVVVGEPQTKQTYTPMYANQDSVEIPVIASTSSDPTYTTETSCVKLGTLEVSMPILTGDKDREVDVQMFYSGTELEIKADDKTRWVFGVSYVTRSSKLLVAAVDFGTTFSGYAFSFRYEYETDPAKITGKIWQSRTGLLSSMKAPTCLLMKPNKSFAAFGYDAENEYSKLALEGEHQKWYYFKRFKMLLHDRMDIKRDIELEDETGKTVSAITVFSLAIKFLKDDLLQDCKNKLTELYEEDIHWVLTTPAIWTDAAKQFMREAAVKAGIDGDSLEIALEPEAASIYCRHIPLQRKEKEGKVVVECFSPGSKYLVLDAGGGTVDITVHEVTANRSIRELHQASGGPWGGTMVDDEFKKLLISIFGSPSLITFQQEYMEDYLELLREFELKKRDTKPDSNDKVTFRVPVSLRELFEKKTGEKIQEALSNMRIKNSVRWLKDKLQLEASVMRQFFEKAINDTIKHVEKILQRGELRSVSTILMVGGFAESAMLQGAVRSKFPRMQILIPPDAGAAVLKGAVIYGHNPRTILERKVKYTYGVSIMNEFDPSKHDEKHKKDVSGVDYCDNIFSKHVEIGATVKVGEPQQDKPYVPVYENQSQMAFEVFASTKNDPKYTTDSGCVKLGKLTVDMPILTGNKERQVRVQMFYSGTELGVKAKDETSGKTAESTFDFLG